MINLGACKDGVCSFPVRQSIKGFEDRTNMSFDEFMEAGGEISGEHIWPIDPKHPDYDEDEFGTIQDDGFNVIPGIELPPGTVPQTKKSGISPVFLLGIAVAWYYLVIKK